MFSLNFSISSKGLKCVVWLPPFLSFWIFCTRLKSPHKTKFSHSKVDRLSKTLLKKLGSWLLGAYIFCRVIILSSVLISTVTVINLPRGSKKYFWISKEKLLLNNMETPALQLQRLLNRPLYPHSANYSFSISFELWTSCRKQTEYFLFLNQLQVSLLLISFDSPLTFKEHITKLSTHNEKSHKPKYQNNLTT